VNAVYTDSDGNYIIGGLPAGTYRVQFDAFEDGNYVSEAYDNAVDLDSGTDIVIAIGEPATGIDASLAHVNAANMIRAQPSGEEGYEILFTGTPGLNYILQHAATLTNEWSDIGSAITAISGANALAIPSSSTNPFWRIRLQP
jgi:hypothetical protein